MAKMHWKGLLLAELLFLALCEISYVGAAQQCTARDCVIDIFYVSPENEDWFLERRCPPNLYSGRNDTSRDPTIATADIYYFYCRVCDRVAGNFATCRCYLCHWTRGCFLQGLCSSVSIDTPHTLASVTYTTQSLVPTTEKTSTPNETNPSPSIAATGQLGNTNIIVAIGVTVPILLVLICCVGFAILLGLVRVLLMTKRKLKKKPKNKKQESIYMEVRQSRDGLAQSFDGVEGQNSKVQCNLPLGGGLSFEDVTKLPDDNQESEKLGEDNYQGFGLSAAKGSNEMYGIMAKRESQFSFNEETDPWYFNEMQMKRMDSTRNNSGKLAFLKVPSFTERTNAKIQNPCFDNYARGIEKSIEKSVHSYEAFDVSNGFKDPPETKVEIIERMSHMRFKEINPNTMRIVDILGKGEYGSVLKAVWESPLGEAMVAVKVLKDSEEDGERVKTAFLQEAAILGQFSHPNILRLVGVVTLTAPNMIVTELMQEELKRFLLSLQTQHQQDVDYETIAPHFLSFSRQVASGMQHLAQRECIHRDIAARNILLTDKCVCKIGDFGMSRRLETESDYYKVKGSHKLPIKWSAPEAIFFKRYTLKSDVWSYGMLLYEIWSMGRKPWPYEDNRSAVEKMARAANLPPPAGCPRSLYQLMVSTWHPKPDQRPDMNEVVSRLSLPDEELLARPELEGRQDAASMIGEEPAVAGDLYMDLQVMYQNIKNDYQ